MATTLENIDTLKRALAQGLDLKEARIIARGLGLTPKHLFMSLINANRVLDAVTYAEVTMIESILPLARKIRAGEFTYNGEVVYLPDGSLPKKVEKMDNDFVLFYRLVNQDDFKEAIRFGRKSIEQKVRDMADMLRDGKFIREGDQFRIPPQPGFGSVAYFWVYYQTHGHVAAYRWMTTVPALDWFIRLWDEGKAKNPNTGEFLKPVFKEALVERRSAADGGAAFAKAKKRKAKRAEQDRKLREAMKTPSGGGNQRWAKNH